MNYKESMIRFTLALTLVLPMGCSTDNQHQNNACNEVRSKVREEERVKAINAIVDIVLEDQRRVEHAVQMAKKYKEAGDKRLWKDWSDSIMYYGGRFDCADIILDHYKPQP